MIEVENVWKQYKLGNTVNFNRTFREAMSHKFSRTNSALEANEKFWALQDINLSIKSGQSLGLIGHNGAGKSTLLKVLSRITKPTRGKITIHGSLSSLLEVGTGFHPELSGRENIYLYGAIMGMSRQDIALRFDQIVDYAGVEKFLDTPVKRYSSGMHVRLAFSIAAHVEPDILVVDEVLAVGDKEFREKCLGKMDDVANSGRTVVFVSHNMNAIASLCKDVAWLDRGQVRETGETSTVISSYENSLSSSDMDKRAAMLFNGSLREILTLESMSIQGISNNYLTTIKNGDSIVIVVRWRASKNISKLTINLALYTDKIRLMTLDDHQEGVDQPAGTFTSEFIIPAGTFRNADISVAIGGKEKSQNLWCWAEGVAKINTVSDGLSDPSYANDVLLPQGNGRRLTDDQ